MMLKTHVLLRAVLLLALLALVGLSAACVAEPVAQDEPGPMGEPPPGNQGEAPPPAGGSEGVACSSTSVCSQGLRCLRYGDDQFCVMPCTDPAQCDSGECNPVDGSDLGWCALQMAPPSNDGPAPNPGDDPAPNPEPEAQPEPEPEPGPKPDPTPDRSPLTIDVLEPQDGEVRPTDSELLVIAEVMSNASLDRVELQWDFNGNAYACPISSTYVQCRIDGNRYTWTVTLGTADTRPFRVQAFDTAGNEVTTQTATIDVR